MLYRNLSGISVVLARAARMKRRLGHAVRVRSLNERTERTDERKGEHLPFLLELQRRHRHRRRHSRLPDGKIVSLPFLGLRRGGWRGGAIQGEEGIKFCSAA